MWTWPFKISPFGIGTVIAGVVVVGSSLAAWLVDDKVSACNAGWEWKIADANLRLKEATTKADAKIAELEGKLRDAEEKALVQAATDKVVLEKQREDEKLSVDCNKCRVPNSWIWVRKGDATGGVDKQRASTQSRRVDAPKAN